jgi:hypothetical protein
MKRRFVKIKRRLVEILRLNILIFVYLVKF